MKNAEKTNETEFGFQWHITNRCNLRCAHCYQEDYSAANELDINGLKSIANEIIATLSKWNKKGDIAITGGEPLLKQEFFPLINYLESSDKITSLDILSNGTLIDESVVEQIAALKKIRCVQISLEGSSSEFNDAIRGKGTFQKAIASIRLLRNYDIEVNIMFTLQRNNLEDIPSFIDLAIAEGVNTLTIERFVPIGSGNAIKNQLISAEEMKNAFEYISERAEQEIRRGTKTSISRSRPLWVMCNRNRQSISDEMRCKIVVGGVCSIGLDGLCILPDATVLACRRLPIPIGDLKRDSLEKIWFTSDLLWQIADKRNLKGKCNSCEFVARCSGCRAMAYAYTGDYLAEDPQCWKEDYKEEDENGERIKREHQAEEQVRI